MELTNVSAKSSIPPEALPNGNLSSEQIFQFLRSEQIDMLSNASSSFLCKAGDTIYRKGMETVHVFRVIKGEVVLLLPQKGNQIVIDQIGPGAIFGSSLSFVSKQYFLTARCTTDSEILKINAAVLKEILDAEPRVGYAIQSTISETYFTRYIQTMNKLQNAFSLIPIGLRDQTGAISMD